MSDNTQPECPAEYLEFEIGEEVCLWDYGRNYFVRSKPYTNSWGQWVIDVSFGNEKPRMENPAHLQHLPNHPLHPENKRRQELETLRARLEEAEARVKELGDSLLQAQQDRITNSSQWSAMYDEIARQRNENLQRALKAEARASAEAAKLERVKALLDGVGPVVDYLNEGFEESPAFHTYADTLVFNALDDATKAEGILCDNLPALLSVISEVREVLKGE